MREHDDNGGVGFEERVRKWQQYTYRKQQSYFTLIMDALDEYDIRTGFDAMDDNKFGTIGMDQFFTLYLALGYPRLEQHQLEQYVRQTRKNYRQEVTKDMALQVLSQVRVVLFLKASRGNARCKDRLSHSIYFLFFLISLTEIENHKWQLRLP
jgi:hypothetical protein